MMPIAEVTASGASLAFQIASWILSTFIGAFVYGLSVGRWKSRIEARLDAEAVARRQALELEAAARKAALDLEAAERRAELDTEAAARQSALELVAREHAHVLERLSAGDRDIKGIPALTSGMQNLADQLKATASVLKELVTKDHCNDRHSSLERLCNERHK